MKSAFVLAAALAAICAVTTLADDFDVEAAVKTVVTQAEAQKKDAVLQVADFRREPRRPEHRGPVGPGRRHDRWERRIPWDGWRPLHYAAYLGYSVDMPECQAYGRASGFAFVTRYNFSGDCYGDRIPY